MSGAQGSVHLTINSVGCAIMRTFLLLKVAEPRAGHGNAVPLLVRNAHLTILKTILKTIARLGNASGETKSASVFGMPDK